MMNRRTVGWLAVAALGGCGEETTAFERDQDAATALAEDFRAAYANADAEEVCALSARETQASLADNGGPGATCPEGVRASSFKSSFPPASLKDWDVLVVRVRDQSARAELGTGSGPDRKLELQLELIKEATEWRVKGPFGD